MQAVSDEQLIQWVAAGDASCLGTLFERHHNGVYQFCLQMTRQRAASEDLTQDVFMRLLQKANTFRGEGSFKAWMFNIARNVALDHLRSGQRRNTHTGADDAMDAYLVDNRSAEQDASGREDLGFLAAALARLPEAAREVIWLGRFEFDSYDELGRALGCNAGAARVRMHRAMRLLHEQYDTLNGVTANA